MESFSEVRFEPGFEGGGEAGVIDPIYCCRQLMPCEEPNARRPEKKRCRSNCDSEVRRIAARGSVFA